MYISSSLKSHVFIFGQWLVWASHCLHQISFCLFDPDWLYVTKYSMLLVEHCLSTLICRPYSDIDISHVVYTFFWTIFCCDWFWLSSLFFFSQKYVKVQCLESCLQSTKLLLCQNQWSEISMFCSCRQVEQKFTFLHFGLEHP